MAINLHEKYSAKILERFFTKSLILDRLNKDYSFSGVATVKITIPETVPLNDYVRNGTNRYGDPKEIQDHIQELVMTQDKSFSMTVDKGNNQDQQGVKAAGKMMKMEVDEVAVPAMDKYVFERLANLAGTIVGNTTAINKSNVAERITAGTTALDDAEVPQESRYLYVTAPVHAALRQSDLFERASDSINDAAIKRGKVGMFDNMEVIKVPKSRMPANVNFMIVYKNAATAPVKLNDTKLHQDPPGISGNLMEGRFRWDAFVFETKAAGIYVDVNTASGAGTVLAAPTITANTGAISASGGASVKYTIDGTDPRYSSTAAVGTTATGAEEGDTIKAYAFKEGAFNSPVATAVKTSA